jgi:hypothetical protein
MKQIAFIASAALLTLVTLASCSREDPAGRAQRITLEAVIGAPTRATTYGKSEVFNPGDQVSLYAWTGSSEFIPSDLVVGGVVNELQQNGSWKSASDMFWKNAVTPHYFLSLYPARTVTNFVADRFQLVPSNYEANDLLVALNLDGLTASEDPVPLAFDHVMARLQVNMKFRTQWSATPKVEVKAQACTAGVINYLEGSIIPDSMGSISLETLPSPEKGYALSCHAIMIPQKDFRTVTLTVDGQELVFTNASDIKLKAGKVTTINLEVGLDRIDLASDINVSEWSAAAVIENGEAQDE